jgi:hypothetical protein
VSELTDAFALGVVLLELVTSDNCIGARDFLESKVG